MKSLIDRLPCKMHVSVFRIYNKNTDKSIHVFSVFELLEPDMEDVMAPATSCHLLSKFNCNAKGEKISFDELTAEITQDWLADPMNSYVLPSKKGKDTFNFINKEFTQIPDGDQFYLLSEYTDKSGLQQFLPNTDMPTWVKTYADSRGETLKYIEDGDLLKQLGEVSQKTIGVNLKDYPEYVGNIIFMWHHPHVRHINIKGASIPSPGVVVSIDFRQACKCALSLNVSQVEQADCVVYDKTYELKPVFRQFVSLPTTPSRNSFKVYDEDGDLIYNVSNLAFLRQFDLTVSTPGKTVKGVKKQTTDKGEVELPPVVKWNDESLKVGDDFVSYDDYYSQGQAIRDVNNMITDGSFVFFDGDNSRKDCNSRQPKQLIHSLLEKGVRCCYICDDYFDASDFEEYVYRLRHIRSEIRILSSRKYIKKSSGGVRQLASLIESYNKALGRDLVSCRLLIGGKPILHDRFIIVDDNIWSIGASLNELGARATVVYKIPNEAGLKIIETVERWWNDENISKRL